MAMNGPPSLPLWYPSATAETYAAKFTDNCLTNLDLPDLDKTIFNSLNITVPGDQLAILHLA